MFKKDTLLPLIGAFGLSVAILGVSYAISLLLPKEYSTAAIILLVITSYSIHYTKLYDRLITQTAINETFPDLQLKLGSTKGTNALLENKGAKTLFVVTKGFADLLKIGNQARPDIFALNVIKRNNFV